MRKFRILIVIATVFAIISSVAMAASVEFSISPIEYDNEDTVTISLIAGTDVEKVTGFYATLEYDKDVFEVTSTSDKDNFVADNNEGYIDIYPENIAFTNGTAVFSFTAKVLNKEKAVGSVFALVGATVNGASFNDEDKLLDEAGTVCTMTVTKKTVTPVEPEKPVITKNETKGATIETEDTIYTNIFKGEYSATPVEGVGISEIGIKYHNTDVTASDAVTLKKNVTIEGGATVNFKAAILGVAADTELVVEPYTVYDFAK